MWDLYLDCKTWGGRPSQRFDWPCLQNKLTGWKLDHAVLYVGLTIENALHERVPTGDPKQHETRPKYALAQLLDSRFRLPRPQAERSGVTFEDFVEQLRALAALPGSRGRMWRYVPPEPEQVQ